MDWSEIGDKFSELGDRMGRSLKAWFGSRNERMVRDLTPLVARINALEPWAKGLDAAAFAAKTAEWKAAVQSGAATLDSLLPEAYALGREAAVRTLGQRHFGVQLVGGIVLHRGSIAEMATGEGKTLVATLPLYLNALAGKPVYLVTVNDYLARRDAEWMGPIYAYLGLTYGAIQSQMGSAQRLGIYRRDIVYGTNNEFGFDYLRDNMKMSVEEQVQLYLSYAIIDEIDSILIDEARTPLIISGPAEYLPDKYKAADMVARKLVRDTHYEVKEKERSASLLEDGIVEAQRILGIESFYTEGNTDWPHYIENAIRAHTLYEKEKEYLVENGEVIIVDEFTGRKMIGRRWSDGLHQAVETKEGIKIKPENQTLATITFQNYFRLYDKLGGMTGTAITEAGEFLKIYGLDVISIPTNLPVARDDQVDVVYRTEPEKWKAITEEIEHLQERGQPVLVGTTSVENSEKLSGILKRRGIRHEVLNAKAGQEEREGLIVALAGEKGAVTVSTNMAGRGTDIKLGGNFEYRLRKALDEAGLVAGDLEHLDEIARIREDVRTRCQEDEAAVIALGGLYVLGTERHEARRIDNQLRGRSGRQGDPGVSRFFLSLQDPLMRRFYRDWVTNMMERLGMTEGVPIESPMVTRAIEKAQRKVEDYYFEIRKSLLEYDEVMDQQRKTIYGVRQEVLENLELKRKVLEMFESVVNRQARAHEGDPERFRGWYQRTFGFELAVEQARLATSDDEPDSTPAIDAVIAAYEAREKELGEELMRKVDRHILLHTLDAKWMDHLRAITGLRQGIGLRGYAQRDPKNEYKAEGFQLFEKLLAAVEDEVTALILRVQVRRPEDEEAAPSGARPRPASFTGGGADRPAPGRGAAEAERAAAAVAAARLRQRALRPAASAAFDRMKREQAREVPPARSAPAPAAPAPAPPMDFQGVGRNDPCPCGSGKKFKKCHGQTA
ncbi:MAG: preprotein translocase subunit SecA [Planctomycetota bacterium]